MVDSQISSKHNFLVTTPSAERPSLEPVKRFTTFSKLPLVAYIFLVEDTLHREREFGLKTQSNNKGTLGKNWGTNPELVVRTLLELENFLVMMARCFTDLRLRPCDVQGQYMCLG